MTGRIPVRRAGNDAVQEATMSDTQHLQHLAILAGPPKLNHDELLAAQKETLDTPRRPYGRAARLLFNALDTYTR